MKPEPMQACSARGARRRLPAMLVLLTLLAACGGGGDGATGGVEGPASCSVADQKNWLSRYFDQHYFWYAISPRPDPAAAGTVDAHFTALLYTGNVAPFPADRWSGFETTESFNRFYGDGQTLGFGLSVAGLEVAGQPAQPLFVRGVDPGSPAALAGLVRGDQILSLNGRNAADLIGANDFAALTATAVGQSLAVQWRSGDGATRNATLAAAVFALTPVPRTQVVTTAGGRRLGYVEVRNMISQASAPLDAAFAQFKAQGVADVVLDLRYNGGGLVSMGAQLASYVAGARGAGQSYARLLYNDRQSASNQTFGFVTPPLAAAAGLPRVFVLAGRRTCSASEQVINGLRGIGLQVITIGETTCGKPVGFLPQSDGCGTTYSVVNFESVNQKTEGRYFDGFAATCAVAEDFTQPVGSNQDPLMSVAQVLADGGACAVSAPAGRQQPMSTQRLQRGAEPGERPAMIPR